MIWREVERDKFSLEEIVTARCPAGSGIFFDTKILRAAGHNRSEHPRRTIQTEWVGENALSDFARSLRFSRLKAAKQTIHRSPNKLSRRFRIFHYQLRQTDNFRERIGFKLKLRFRLTSEKEIFNL